MEKKFRLLLLLALLLTAATGAWAQEQWDVVWDFTAWSTETVTALKADAAASKLVGWSDVEKQADAESGADPTEAAKDNCFWFAGTVNEDGSLSANGAVIKELKGLKFNSDYAAKRSLAIAVNYPSTSLGDYAGGAYLWLGGGGSKQTCPCFTIPGVKAGSKITVEVESYKLSDGRGIGLYKNSYAAENLIGEQFTPTTFEAKTWEIAEDCDVVVWNTSGCHIYTIKVKAPAAAPAEGYTVSMKSEVKDADKWTVKVGEGQAQALPIGGLKGDGSETVTLQYNGRLKVKGVKATSDAAPAKTPATVTTAPTATTGDIAAGSTTALVSGGAAEGGTLMYKVTTENTKPTSTDGFSADVPTAKTLAAGTYYVWYYVKADDSHTDSEISATAIAVTVKAAVSSESFTTNQGIATYDGTHFTITCTTVGDSDGIEIEGNNPLTITAKNGETITKVEFHCMFGSGYASQTTVTAGTLNWTTGSETGSIDNVNASTVSMSNSNVDWVQINQITVYYTE